ncbi:transposase, partial [Candidatus Parcubacteria bacterium]|nr:transposase [Candidatus Parcubacteria bacterium]
LARLSNSPGLSWLQEQTRLKNISKADLLRLEERYGPPLLDILAYTLMPNHFHFEIKELTSNGKAKFFQKLGTAYTKYFNKRHDRTGRLFESKYKAVEIESDEQLIHLSRYIHTNLTNSSKLNLTPGDLKTYPWSSLPDYLGTRKQPFCHPTEILERFGSKEKYWEFVKAIIRRNEPLLPPHLQIDRI